MSTKIKFYLKPLTLIAVCFFILWISDAWKLSKWLPPSLKSSSRKADRLGLLFASSGTSLIDMLTSCASIEEIAKFVDNHPDNADYQFALGAMREYGIENMRRAEELDPTNPIYPYWLGISYLQRPIQSMAGKSSYDPDSALAAFKRASILDPENAAIDLAKAYALTEITECSSTVSYRARLVHDYSLFHNILTEEGRECIIEAMDKTSFRSYSSDAVSASLRLLSDSGNNTFNNRTIFAIGGVRLLGFHGGLTAIKLFVEDIRPFEDEERVSATADTLLRLSNLGLMMRDDPSMSIIQFIYGSLVTTICLDMLGDLYLLNDMPVEARLAGQFMADIKNWRHNASSMFYYGFLGRKIVRVLNPLGLFAAIQVSTIFILALFVAAMAILLIKGAPAEEKDSICWLFYLKAVFLGFGLTMLFFVMIMIDVTTNAFFREILLVAIASVFIASSGILIYRIATKRRSFDEHLFGFISSMLICLVAIACFLFKLPILCFSGFAIGIILSALHNSRKKADRLRNSSALIAKSSALCFAVFTVIIIIVWIYCSNFLYIYMNHNDYSFKYAVSGKLFSDLDQLQISDYGAHFQPNESVKNLAREKRIERLEEMFGKIENK
jgi:hypothetical protein